MALGGPRDRMPEEKILLIGCGILKKEIEFLINKNKWPINTLFLDSSLHIDPDKLGERLKSALTIHKGRDIIVFYGSCHPLMAKILDESGVLRTKGQNCVEMLLGHEIFTEELAKGAYFILENWAEHWDYIMNKSLGRNEEIWKEIFRVDRKYLLGIKTPCSGDFRAKAEEAALTVGLPLSWIRVSLDNLESVLLEEINIKMTHTVVDKVIISRQELNNFQDRLRKLASEKACLQLMINIMNKLSTTVGLENTIEAMLTSILDNIGGTNLKLYYVIDNGYYYADILGKRERLEHIDDELIKKAFETKKFIEVAGDFSQTLMVTPEFTRSNTWVFPLIVGPDVIGALKIEDLHISALEFKLHLPALFNYAALILKNEILGYSRLKKINDQLKEENSERKRAEGELRQANERLKELDLRKSAFVAKVSHEFRNPLTVINGALNLILEKIVGDITSKQDDLLKSAKLTTERLIRLVSDLLDISKIEAGKMELKKEHVDIVRLIEEILFTYTLEIEKRDLSLKEELPRREVFLWLDKDKITEVIINLLNNAMKYTPAGGSVSVSLIAGEKEIRFECANSGPAIPAEYLEKIFDKFERITVERKEGTGLGLPIAKDIVELHKGKLWVESCPGKDNTFIFILPRGKEV